jgi:hypothetical protein
MHIHGYEAHPYYDYHYSLGLYARGQPSLLMLVPSVVGHSSPFSKVALHVPWLSWNTVNSSSCFWGVDSFPQAYVTHVKGLILKINWSCHCHSSG